MFDPEVDRLDYGFIAKCDDRNELEAIVRDLRSGKHGMYPHLEQTAEARLRLLFPNSRVLRKMQTHAEVDSSDIVRLNSELLAWKDNITSSDALLQDDKKTAGTSTLPPVRGIAESSTHETPRGPVPAASTAGTERLKSRDWDGWSRYDADAAVASIDSADKASEQERRARAAEHRQRQHADEMRRSGGPAAQAEQVAGDTCSAQVEWLAERKREKGNDCFRAGEYAEAKQLYTCSIDLCVTVAALNNRALCHHHLKNYDAAIADCAQVLRRDPGNAKALVRRARAEKELFRYEEAAASYKRAIELGMSSDTVHKELALVENRLAEEHKDKSTALPSKKVKMRIQEVDGADSDTDTDTDADDKGSDNTKEAAESVANTKGADIIADAVAHKPAPHAAARSEPQAPAPAPARDTQWHGDTTPKTSPPKIAAELARAEAFVKSGQYDTALELFNVALKGACGNDYIRGLNAKCVCQLKLGRLSECTKSCTEVLSHDPMNTDALVMRARANEEKERYVDAMADHQRVLTINPKLATASQALSRLRSLSGNQDRKSIEKARVEMRGDEIRLRGNRALLAGDVAGAKVCYTECCALCPMSVAAFTNRSLANIKLGLWGDALADTESALELDAHNIKAHYRRACALQGLGRIAEAKTTVARILAEDCTHVAAINMLDQLNAQQLKLDTERKKPKKRVLIQEVDDDDDDDDNGDGADGADDNDNNDDNNNYGDDDNYDNDGISGDAMASPTEKMADRVISETTKEDPEGAESRTGICADASPFTSVHGSTASLVDTDANGSTTNLHRRESMTSIASTTSLDEWVVVKDKGVQAKATTKAAAGGADGLVPTSAPTSYYAFESKWNHLHKEGGVDALCKYLIMMHQSPGKFTVLISNQLEADLMVSIITVLDNELAQKAPEIATAILEALQKAPRFSMVAMFLSSQQKAVVSNVFNKLDKLCGAGDANTALRRLRNLYE